MIIIGEKINGTLKKTGAAIGARDEGFIKDLARRQVAAGADYLDVNAGTAPERESDDLVWLIETVQSAVNVPLCLDSANPTALKSGMECVKQTPMVNSISGEASRLESILPLAAQRGSPVIALLLDDAGIPADVDKRVSIARRILAETRRVGVPDENVYIDPLAMALATKTDGCVIALETMRDLRAQCSGVRFSMGLSNVSFGLPLRTIINQAFLAQALAAGLEAAIMDPLDQGLYNVLMATELVLGRDHFCRNYTHAFRAKKITIEAKG